MPGNDGFNFGLMIALRRMDIVVELLRRDPKASRQKVIADAEALTAWAFSGSKDIPDKD
jgi:hypothetical protein